jgi:2-oxoglutarate dehydrogenase E1 component
MLLPHGYEGQGPEHSNAYLERYLAACAEHNVQVADLTTPAQYFHALRRQVRRPFRRPLIVMSPKSLLRHPRCVSPVRDLVEGRFEEILEDPSRPEGPRRLVLCTGKVFYDLLEKRDATGAEVEIVRVEQLYPLSQERLQAIVDRAGTDDIVWAQEEPENRGAFRYMHLACDRLGIDLRYVGRRASASPATGSMRVHREQQEQLVVEAIEG